MSIPKFDPKELVTTIPDTPGMFGMPPIKQFAYPVTSREAYKMAYEKKAVWQLVGMDMTLFTPSINPDNIARAFVFEAEKMPPEEGGGKDMFGIEWEYILTAGGSMVRPGKPFIEDANEWYEKLVWPDIDSWDWEACYELNKDFFKKDKLNVLCILNGWYERLISFMDFEGAILSLIDEDQKDAVKELFDRLSDLYIKMIGRFFDYFPDIDSVNMHDDWGSQKECFFAPAVAEEMIVPAMKKVTDFIHSKGRIADLHSCGQLMKQVPNMIKAGWDSWTGQPMNDMQKIYELYGDHMLFGVAPDKFDPDTTSEEEQRALARSYCERFCNPEKPSKCSFFGVQGNADAFLEELYKQSRINYSK